MKYFNIRFAHSYWGIGCIFYVMDDFGNSVRVNPYQLRHSLRDSYNHCH